MKDLNQDFQDLINCLSSHNVEFLIVGAHALAFHGISRYTADLDLWVRRTSDNAEHLRGALAEFGIKLSVQEISDFLAERRFLRFGIEPFRVEILNF